MKLYTGTGDRGMTSLFSGERVLKQHSRVEAYGDVDELNCVLGALASILAGKNSELVEEIQRIQSDLFHIGAWLATEADSPSKKVLEEIKSDKRQTLERAIDRMHEKLPELRDFILPGGHLSAAWAHIARTVCRRTERHVVRMLDEKAKDKTDGSLHEIIAYLNRLSDYLFVTARYCNHVANMPDMRWKE